MVMYQNMAAFSNVTGNVVLNGHRMGTAKGVLERDTLFKTNRW